VKINELSAGHIGQHMFGRSLSLRKIDIIRRVSVRGKMSFLKIRILLANYLN